MVKSLKVTEEYDIQSVEDMLIIRGYKRPTTIYVKDVLVAFQGKMLSSNETLDAISAFLQSDISGNIEIIKHTISDIVRYIPYLKS